MSDSSRSGPYDLRPSDSASENGPGAELLDLPLDDAEPEAAEPELAPRPPHPADRRRRARRWPWVLLAFVALPLAALAGWALRPGPPVMALETPLVDLGEVRLGALSAEVDVSLANRGERPLELGSTSLVGDAAAEFRLVADGCGGRAVAPEQSCALRLSFAPAAAGLRRARLEVSSNAVNGDARVALLGTGVSPRLELSPARLDFGRHQVGTAGPRATLELRNAGTAPLELGAIELHGRGAGDFERAQDGCSGRALGAGERCAVAFRFLPSAAGERRAAVRVVADAPVPSEPVLVGTGLARRPALELDRRRLDFGRHRVGEAAPPLALGLANSGDGPLRIEALTLTGAATAEVFEILSESCTTAAIEPGRRCSVEVGFRPRSGGAARAELEIRHNAGPRERLALAGEGTAPGASLEPARLSFGEVAAGAASPPRTARLRSSGTAALAVRSIALEGADAAAFAAGGSCGELLAPGSDCALEVSFRPRRDGPHRAELIVRHDAPGGVERLALIGLGAAARLVLEPGRVEFGTVAVGRSAAQRAWLRNAGQAPLGLGRLRLEGRDAGAFVVAVDRCSEKILRAGETCELELRFAPAEPGRRAARLRIEPTAGTARTLEITATAVE